MSRNKIFHSPSGRKMIAARKQEFSTIKYPSIWTFLFYHFIFFFCTEPDLIPTEVEDVVGDLANQLEMDRPSSTSSSSSSLPRNPHDVVNNNILSAVFHKDLQLHQHGVKINTGINLVYVMLCYVDFLSRIASLVLKVNCYQWGSCVGGPSASLVWLELTTFRSGIQDRFFM